MNNEVFGKTMENIKKHRDIKISLFDILFEIFEILFGFRTKLSYYKVFLENLLAIKIKKPHIFINKQVNLGLSILEISKIVMYDFWYAK